MSLVRRGTLINGEFVEGTFEYGEFVRTKFKRGARGLIVMVAQPEKKLGPREQLAKILKFEARTIHRPGAGGAAYPAHKFAQRD